MSEENQMSEENKKTIISFIAGLLIGGLLVFIFVNPGDDAKVGSDTMADDSSEVSDEDADDSEKMDDAEDTSQVSSSNGSNSTTASNTVVGSNGSVTAEDQSAGRSVALKNVVFPGDHGWIGIRDYSDGQLTGLLGVARWNNDEGLFPTSVPLLRSTETGMTYAVVFYSDNGDKVFQLSTDAQIGGSIDTFKAK